MEKESSKKSNSGNDAVASPKNVAEMDYPILVQKFGETKARKIVLLSSALNAMSRQRIGAEKEPSVAN